MSWYEAISKRHLQNPYSEFPPPILRITTLIHHIPTIYILITRIPTLILASRIPIIPLILLPDFLFLFLQIVLKITLHKPYIMPLHLFK